MLRARQRAYRARSPSGALLRLSPGRTHPPLAQLQFPRFLRPGVAGVTRFGLSQVYRAPRRPVVVPVERLPRAARHQGSIEREHFECDLSISYTGENLSYPAREYYR
jgi:hypothetical protein